MPPTRHCPQKKACDVCYQRKIQCSLPNPEGPCEWCDHRNLECTFNRERPRKKRKNRCDFPYIPTSSAISLNPFPSWFPSSSVKSSDVQDLFRRIDQLEEALAKSQTASTLQNLANSDVQAISTPPEVINRKIPTGESSREWAERSPTHSSGNHSKAYLRDISIPANQLGPNWFFNGIPISSEAGYQWISTRTGQMATSVDFSIPIKESSPVSLSVLSPTLLQETCELPSKDTARETLSAFFRSSSRLVCPVLDEFLFKATIETAYEPLDRMRFSTQIPARACVLSALSIAPRSKTSAQLPLSIDPDMCTAKAHALLLHIAGDNSLATLQTALILELQSVFGADWQSAALFHSIACRIVCSLGGHIHHLSKPFEEVSWLEREIRHTRRLFYLSYMLDKDISLRTGHPPLLTDVYCDLTPFDTSLEHNPYLQQPGWDGDIGDDKSYEHTSYLVGNITLSLLKEKVFRLLFSAQALKDNDNQLLLNIRQLDDEIERWRLSIPIDLRPILFIPQNTSPGKCDESIPHIISRMSLQLDYHHLMTVIHTTVRKCTPEAGGAATQDLHEVAHSSFDLSLVASRSTFRCLRHLVSKFPEETFRFIPYYATTAALSLFLDIVMHPLFTQAQLDLELLISAANLIRGIQSHALTKREMDRVQETSNFIMRLVWLGSCAVTKAKREDGCV